MNASPPPEPATARSAQLQRLQRVHRLLCSPFVYETMFRAALGGPRSDLGCVVRYLQLPVESRPDLSPYFDRLFYAVTNAGYDATEPDPLLHFLEHGFARQRSPHPLIDLDYIASQDGHLLEGPHALDSLLDLLDYDLASPSPYFDPAYYRSSLGTAAPDGGLLLHYLQVGMHQGVRPNPMFDPDWYARVHADAPNDAMGALRHLVALGDRQGRATSPEFDGTRYRRRYRDVQDATVPPLAHYLASGMLEGRQPLPILEAVGPASTADALAPAEICPVQALATYRAMKARLRDARQAGAGPPVAPMLELCRSARSDLARVRLPPAPVPRVSILIPVFNELKYTVECLLALVRSLPRASVEVIIADDASSDATAAELARVAHLRVVRQYSNEGFLQNCNAAFLQCRAPYVLLLNNDTQLQPGAVDRMLAVLESMPDVAAVGPKLIYPNGHLQEAGCFLRSDGQSGMVGLGEGPEDDGYAYDRDVTYCSGAALMVRRSCVGDELFDLAYAPAYCEDADLCLRFISRGHRVRYVHDAVVVHHLSVSTNRGSRIRKSRGIIRNQQRLARRWGPLLEQLDAIRPLAFYLPQFHPTPENDIWWGKGFTEWTNVAKARPAYDGHYQPHLPTDLGYYDLRSAESLRAQADLAARYGIEGFCVYYYNLGGARLLSRPLTIVQADPTIPFRWCLCWANENWTRRWDGGDGQLLAEQRYDEETLAGVISDAVGQAADARYIRVRDQPLFLVYRPLLIPDPAAFAARCRAAFVEAGFKGVHLVYVESMETAAAAVVPAAIGFDASVEFPPHGRAVHAQAPAPAAREGWDGMRYSYPDTVAAFCGRPDVPYRRYPAVFPSWDNTPRQPMRSDTFEAATPETFQAYVEEKVEHARRHLMGDERLLFVNAWNEWGEGAHLEPDIGFGHRWLEAFRDGLRAPGAEIEAGAET